LQHLSSNLASGLALPKLRLTHAHISALPGG
jgi:hypothetical protein